MQQVLEKVRAFLLGIVQQAVAEVVRAQFKDLEQRLFAELESFRAYPQQLKGEILDEVEMRLQRVLEKSLPALPTIPKPKFNFFGGSSDG
jgi:hypothetical protein